MRIIAAKGDEHGSWSRLHSDILMFVRQYGARRIPLPVYRRLLKFDSQDSLKPGSSLLIATIQSEDGPRMAGVSCITEYGDSEAGGICIVVVHPLYRGCGIGSKLLSEQLTSLGRISCRISLDNVSSLQMCFRAGLQASRLLKARGRRPELLLEASLSSDSTSSSKEGDLVAATGPGHPDLVSK